MKNTRKNSVLVTLVFLLFIGVTSGYSQQTSTEVKTLFDRYQAIHKQYTDAVKAQASEAKVTALADSLKEACAAYYRAIGVNATYDKLEVPDAPGVQVQSPDESSSTEGTSQSVRRVSKARSSFNKLLAELYSPDRSKKAKELKEKLLEFIKTCQDPELVKEATFELADLVFDMSGSLAEAQKVLVGFAQKNKDPESRRQALARMKMYRQKAKIVAKRSEYKVVQSQTISRWQKFSTTSWLALPKKLISLGSYFVSNTSRFFKARKLDNMLDDYDRAVVATYPKGSADQITRSRVLPCNSAKIMVNGRTSFHYRFEYAKRAQYSLYVQTLLFQDDETGNKLADIMIERANNGVDVKLILDDFFSFGKKKGVIQRLRNSGVEVLINNPVLKNIFKANFRSHQKLFIIDEKFAVVGGMNIGDEYAKGEIEEYGWRDTDVLLEGPIVSEILKLFENNWEELTLKKFNETGMKKYKEAQQKINEFSGLKDTSALIPGPIPVYFENPPYVEDVNCRFVKTTPIEEQDDNILDLFVLYLDRAKQEVIFESAYFIPTDELKDAIRRANKRGVKVKIITNSIESNNHPSGGWAGRDSYEEVLRAGAEIYEWRGAQTVHSKVSLFDDFAVTLGAYNMNSRSHACDSEDIIAFEDFRVARVFKQILYKDLERCQQITLEDALSWNKEFMKKMQMEFFNLFKFMF